MYVISSKIDFYIELDATFRRQKLPADKTRRCASRHSHKETLRRWQIQDSWWSSGQNVMAVWRTCILFWPRYIIDSYLQCVLLGNMYEHRDSSFLLSPSNARCAVGLSPSQFNSRIEWFGNERLNNQWKRGIFTVEMLWILTSVQFGNESKHIRSHLPMHLTSWVDTCNAFSQ